MCGVFSFAVVVFTIPHNSCTLTAAEVVSINMWMSSIQFSHVVIINTEAKITGTKLPSFCYGILLFVTGEVGRAVRKLESVTALCSAVLFD